MLNSTLNIIYTDTDISEEYCTNKINEINQLCNNYYNLMSGINLDNNVINYSNIQLNSDSNNSNSNNSNSNNPDLTNNETSGTSIDDLLKLRQEEQIQQMLIDTNEKNNYEENNNEEINYL